MRAYVCVCVLRRGGESVCVSVDKQAARSGAEGRVLPLHWLSIAVSLLREAHT